jgi:hypothetical protein
MSNELFEDMYAKAMNQLSDNLSSIDRRYSRVACFTPERKSILMWSHYAASHTGYCIEYNTRKFEDGLLDFIYPVIYSNKRFDSTDLFKLGNREKTNTILNHIIYKAKEWEYENEWRIIFPEIFIEENKSDYLQLRNSISAIYLGCNCKEDDNYKLIKNWAESKNIPMYKMRPSKTQYRLIQNKI